MSLGDDLMVVVPQHKLDLFKAAVKRFTGTHANSHIPFKFKLKFSKVTSDFLSKNILLMGGRLKVCR